MTLQTEIHQHVVTGIIDGDGHIFERDEQLYPYLAPKYKPYELENYYFFPDLDGRRRLGRGPEWGADDPEGWLRFLDYSGITKAVIYPTAALAFGFMRDSLPGKPGEWPVDVCTAYNDFIYDNYLKKSDRFNAVALLPVQHPDAAAKELRRANRDLGMVGGLLPTPGLPQPYGHSSFDPLYEEAQRLGTMLAIHGAAQRGLGFDNFDHPSAGFILGHPFGQMTQFVSMLYGEVWDKFPELKVAFLEASCGWAGFLMERIDQRTERTGRALASETVRKSPIYFHAELEDKLILHHAIEYVGADRLIYASDFPHEPVDGIMDALLEFEHREDLTLEVKEKILRDNIKALYGLKS